MHIKDLQATIKQRDFRPEQKEQYFLKLMEEVGDLAQATRLNRRYHAGDGAIQGTIEEELYDVLYYLLAIANLYEVDVEQAVTLKEQLNQLRAQQLTPASAATIMAKAITTSEMAEAITTNSKDSAMIDAKRISRRFFDELWNQRKLEVADEIFHPDCITNQLRSGTDPVTAPRAPDAVKKQVSDWLVAFPDFRYTIRQMIGDGDRVMTQCVATGTHQGAWLGIPATNREISIETMIIHRIVDGKIVEDWVLADFLGLFQQLGLIPSLQEILQARRG